MASQLTIVTVVLILCGLATPAKSTPIYSPNVEKLSEPPAKIPYNANALIHYNCAVRYHQASVKEDWTYDRYYLVKAREEYLTATTLDHRMYEAWHNLGCAYDALHEYPQAIEAFKTALSVSALPIDNLRTSKALAHIYHVHGDYDRAEVLYKELLTSTLLPEKDRQAITTNYIEVLESMGKKSEAEAFRLKVKF